MPDLKKANEARLLKALNKKYRDNEGVIYTLQERIENDYYSHGEKAAVPSIEWNRRKFNTMNEKEQKEYEQKRAEYRLWLKKDNRCFVIVPKMVYDYFSKLEDKIKC
jgi:hypothetical protein